MCLLGVKSFSRPGDTMVNKTGIKVQVMKQEIRTNEQVYIVFNFHLAYTVQNIVNKWYLNFMTVHKNLVV